MPPQLVLFTKKVPEAGASVSHCTVSIFPAPKAEVNPPKTCIDSPDVSNEFTELTVTPFPVPVQALPTSGLFPTIAVPGAWLKLSEKTTVPLQTGIAIMEMASSGINKGIRCFMVGFVSGLFLTFNRQFRLFF
jgi:hypothetical protein